MESLVLGSISFFPVQGGIRSVRRSICRKAVQKISSTSEDRATLRCSPSRTTVLCAFPPTTAPPFVARSPSSHAFLWSTCNPDGRTRGVLLSPRCSCSGPAGNGPGAGADDAAPTPDGISNEVERGRSSEWMGDEREVEVASRLIAKWKRQASAGEGNQMSAGAEAPLAPPPQDVLLQAVADLSRREGREAKTTNVVIGGTATSAYGDDWLELDKKVNKYPSWRGFTAIGTGGEDFIDSMVVAVESVLEAPIPKWQVSARESAGGRYVSVKIGPVRMESSDQVRAVYEAMKKDERMRYFL